MLDFDRWLICRDVFGIPPSLEEQDRERAAEIAQLDLELAGQEEEEPEPPPSHIEDPSPTGYESGFPFGF